MGPLVIMVAVIRPNTVQRARGVQAGPPGRTCRQTINPSSVIQSVRTVSVRTSIARRGVSRLNPTAAAATRPPRPGHSRSPARQSRTTNATAASSEGNRQAISQLPPVRV